MRAMLGANAMAIAMSALKALAPIAVTIRSANRSPGIVMTASTVRMIASSALPPMNAERVPITAPMPVPITVARTASRRVGRAPRRIRLRRSRPNWSVPSQKSGPGPRKRAVMWNCSGLYGAISGPTAAATIASTTSTRPMTPCGVRRSRLSASGILDPLVEGRIRQVGQEVRNRVGRGHDQSAGLNCRQVSGLDRNNQLATDPREGEDLLHHDDAAQEIADIEGDDSDRGQQRVAQRMAEEHAAAGEALQACGPHIVRVEHVDEL